MACNNCSCGGEKSRVDFSKCVVIALSVVALFLGVYAFSGLVRLNSSRNEVVAFDHFGHKLIKAEIDGRAYVFELDGSFKKGVK